jgi:16S rRNA (uracil1498-N3)-methyltransferase
MVGRAVRAPVPGLAAGERLLEGALAHYLFRVLRLRVGDDFVAFDPATGAQSDAVVAWADESGVTVRLGPLREARSSALREGVIWIQGLAKGDKCDAIVRDATELGASRIIVATTERTVVKLDAARAEARQARWARIAQEAARQCGRADAPAIDTPCPWADALERAGGADRERDARFCLWEGATEPLAPLLIDALSRRSALAFACGPEGGLTAKEVDLARSRGWAIVSVGPLVLRTETVATAVLGAARVWEPLF